MYSPEWPSELRTMGNTNCLTHLLYKNLDNQSLIYTFSTILLKQTTSFIINPENTELDKRVQISAFRMHMGGINVEMHTYVIRLMTLEFSFGDTLLKGMPSSSHC